MAGRFRLYNKPKKNNEAPRRKRTGYLKDHNK